MSAEETALDSFRNAVERVRMHREAHVIAECNGNPTEQYAHWRLASNARDEVSMLARIIRAIRAERTPFHAMERRLADSIEGGIEAGIELIKARAYEQGRRDALRGVQGACLYEAGRLEELPKEHKRGGEYWDWSGYREEMQVHYALCEIAEAAEEAAR